MYLALGGVVSVQAIIPWLEGVSIHYQKSTQN
jgi:hypothetical protein